MESYSPELVVCGCNPYNTCGNAFDWNIGKLELFLRIEFSSLEAHDYIFLEMRDVGENCLHFRSPS